MNIQTYSIQDDEKISHQTLQQTARHISFYSSHEKMSHQTLQQTARHLSFYSPQAKREKFFITVYGKIPGNSNPAQSGSNIWESTIDSEGFKGGTRGPPLCRETQSLGQQMLMVL